MCRIVIDWRIGDRCIAGESRARATESGRRDAFIDLSAHYHRGVERIAARVGNRGRARGRENPEDTFEYKHRGQDSCDNRKASFGKHLHAMRTGGRQSTQLPKYG